MATYYHWVGATANSVDKYDWNIASNWIVQSTGIDTTTGISTPYSRATRSPIANDTVIIGETFHCLSPLLFGGFDGTTGHSAGSWGNGYTAGATAGGVNLTVQTDILSASSVASWSQISAQLRNPDGTFYYGLAMGGVHGASGSFSQNMTDTNFIYLLRNANPHFPMGTWNRLTGKEANSSIQSEMAFYGSYDAFCQTAGCVHVDGEYGPRATKYPFPFLGGGLTGKALQWALGQYRKSYYGYGLGKGGTANDAWVASRSDAVNAAALRNAWIGGGVSGSAADLAGTANRAANTPLRLRVQSLRFLTPAYQAGGESINNPLYADIDLVGDKAADGTIASTIYINQPKSTYHAFRLEGGTIRSLDIMGDSSVDVVGMTAATVNSEYSSYIRSDSTSRFGGLRIKSIPMGRDRYNTYSGWHMAGITSGARYAVWGAQATAANKDANASKLILEQPNAYDINVNQIPGVSSTAYLNPMFAIGVVDGTTGQSGGAVTIPTMECKSGADLGSVWQIHFSGPSLIQRIDDSGSNYVVASPLATKTNSVEIGTLNGSNGTIVNFRENPDVDNIYFGGTTGSGNSLRIIGGIVSLDDTVSIIPSKGCAFINTKSVDGIVDGRGSHKSGSTQFTSLLGDYAAINAPPTASQER